ncbi:MAG: hypothetical protein ACFFD4_35210, partial [Candidatus Odinarchaeota archaeon]
MVRIARASNNESRTEKVTTLSSKLLVKTGVVTGDEVKMSRKPGNEVPLSPVTGHGVAFQKAKKSVGSKNYPSRSPRDHPLPGGLKGLEKVMVLLLLYLLKESEKEYTAAELARKLTNCSPAAVIAACEQLVRLELLNEKTGFFLFRFLGRNKEPKYCLPRRTALLAKLVDKRGQQVVFRDKKDQKALAGFVDHGLIRNQEDSYRLVPVLAGDNHDREYYVNKAHSLQVPRQNTNPKNQVVIKDNAGNMAEKPDRDRSMNHQQVSRKLTKDDVLATTSAVVGYDNGGDITISEIICKELGIVGKTPVRLTVLKSSSFILSIQKPSKNLKDRYFIEEDYHFIIPKGVRESNDYKPGTPIKLCAIKGGTILIMRRKTKSSQSSEIFDNSPDQRIIEAYIELLKKLGEIDKTTFDLLYTRANSFSQEIKHLFSDVITLNVAIQALGVFSKEKVVYQGIDEFLREVEVILEKKEFQLLKGVLERLDSISVYIIEKIDSMKSTRKLRPRDYLPIIKS